MAFAGVFSDTLNGGDIAGVCAAAATQQGCAVLGALRHDSGEILRHHVILGDPCVIHHRISCVWLAQQRASDKAAQLGDKIGGHPVSCHTVYVDSVIGMLVFGMTDAQQPAISYCYGAGLSDKVRAMFRRIILGAIVLSAASLLFMMFLGQHVAPLFIKPEDTELLKVSIIGMKIFSLSYLTGWVDMCFSSYFTALERPARSMLVSFFGTLVFPIASLFILTPIFKLNGVWLSALTSCTASAIFTVLLYLTMNKPKDSET